MNKKQWLDYTKKIMNNNGQHLKSDEMIGDLFSDYIENRSKDLATKVNYLSSTDLRSLERFISLMISLIAGDEAVIMALNTMAKDNENQSINVRRGVKATTDQYIREIISKNNQAYDDLK